MGGAQGGTWVLDQSDTVLEDPKLELLGGAAGWWLSLCQKDWQLNQ